MLRVFFVLVVSLGVVSSQSKPSPSDLRKIVKKEGLHKAAIANGGKYELKMGRLPGWLAQAPLGQLVLKSDLVIEAWVESSSAQLTKDGRDIETTYKVQVIEVFKGRAGRSANAVLPDGTVHFTDGTVASVSSRGIEELGRSCAYFLFLNKRSENTYGAGQAPVVIHLDEQAERLRLITPDRVAAQEIKLAPPVDFRNELRRLGSPENANRTERPPAAGECQAD